MVRRVAAPRIFVSSTAYDLGHVRGQLRSAIQALAYEPVLSDFADVLYDPRTHAQTSCIKELASCDAVVLVVGSRFGSVANASALSDIDVDLLGKLDSVDLPIPELGRSISVTQLELLKAVQDQIPVFAFVEERLLHDHSTYLANKHKPFIDELEFASISQPEYAKYIFSFLDFLQARVVNNAIFPFARIEDIELTLKRQWAALFQRLMSEARLSVQGQRRVDSLAEQLDDLKVAILSSIGDAASREVARASLQFRVAIETARALAVPDLRALVEAGATWDDIMAKAGVGQAFPEPDKESASRVVLRMLDGNLFRGTLHFRRFIRLGDEWASFSALSPQQRLAVYDGVVASDTSFGTGFFLTDAYMYDDFMEQLVAVRKRAPDPVYGDEEPF